MITGARDAGALGDMPDTDFADHDWENTPLGPYETWPKQLHDVCGFLHSSKQPMFLLWGPERAFIYNSAYKAIWGGDWNELPGRPITQVAGGNWSRIQPLVQQVFDGQSFMQSDFPIYGVEGAPARYFDFSYTPIRNREHTDTVIGALCISTDVTERFLSTEEIKTSQEVLALTVENVTEGIALVDHDLSLMVWNEPFRLHFGYTRKQLRMGMNAVDLMMETARRGDLGPGEPKAIVERFVHSIFSNDSATLEVQRTNGRVLSLNRRSLKGGRFLLVSHDITEARMTARLKDELVSTVSHELRTPLTAISGALGIVSAGAAGELSDKARRLVEIAQRNCERLITMVNDLLDIDKLQSGRMDLQLEETDLAGLVRTTVEQNGPYAERGGIELLAQVPDQPVMAAVDRNRIIQVITNLISNAVKFSPSDETVIVRLGVEGRLARISVIDHGIGVAPVFRSRLFERFSQHDASASKVQQGTGLGLAICKSIVEHHHGAIWLDTKTTLGSTFHVDLPLAVES